jgi:hypothetical protein
MGGGKVKILRQIGQIVVDLGTGGGTIVSIQDKSFGDDLPLTPYGDGHVRTEVQRD